MRIALAADHAGYLLKDELIHWLTEAHAAPPERVAGLVLIGRPYPGTDPGYDARMLAAHPPQALPPVER